MHRGADTERGFAPHGLGYPSTVPTTRGNLALDDRSVPADRGDAPNAFAYGRPARRLVVVWFELVSLFDLFRAERDHSQPVGLAVAKLLLLTVVGVLFASALLIGLGGVVLRTAFTWLG